MQKHINTAKIQPLSSVNITDRFDPLPLLTCYQNESSGGQSYYLETKYRILWFRTVYPNGKIDSTIVSQDNQRAVVEARVYADAALPSEQFLARAYAYKYRKTDDDYNYIEWAHTAAIGRALGMAGFGQQFCHILEPAETDLVDSPVCLPLKAQQTQQTQQTQETPQTKPRRTTKKTAESVSASKTGAQSAKPATTAASQNALPSILDDGITLYEEIFVDDDYAILDEKDTVAGEDHIAADEYGERYKQDPQSTEATDDGELYDENGHIVISEAPNTPKSNNILLDDEDDDETLLSCYNSRSASRAATTNSTAPSAKAQTQSVPPHNQAPAASTAPAATADRPAPHSDTGTAPKSYEETLATMNFEDAYSTLVTFGLHKGVALGELYEQNEVKALLWFVDTYRGNNYQIRAGAKILLAQLNADGSAA